jgi:putative copper export protein
VARAALAILVLWALALARRPGLALVFVAATVVTSAFAGHSLAIHPGRSVPAKAMHVGAVCVWFGGLVALWLTTRVGAEFQELAARVSTLSLAAVLVLTASGVVQTLLFSPGLALLVRSPYGAVLATKLGGMAVLVAMGARNRYRLVPALPADAARVALRRSVGWELAVMTFVMLAAGLLAYTPVPQLPPGAATRSHHPEMNR